MLLPRGCLTRRSLGALSAASAASVAVLAACGRDAGAPAPGGSSDLEGGIRGAGATSQSTAQEAWMNGFMDANLRAFVDYAGGGSGAGRTKLAAGAVDFAGSDVAVDDAEISGLGGVVELPLYVSPIALVYNLPGLDGTDHVSMTGEVLARVLAGTITSWRDPALVALNEGTDLPDLGITVVHRSDDSGTTRTLTDYLSAAAPQAWPYGGSETWPLEGQSGDGTSGVVQTVSAAPGTIGYADASKVPGSLGTVAVGVPGDFAVCSSEAAAATLSSSELVESGDGARLAYSLNYDAPGAYPLVLVSYLLARQDYEDAGTAAVVRAYLSYAVSAEGQDLAALRAGCVPVPQPLRSRAASAIAMISP
ncbi:phosphate ABC transporter substrate-binding protein PstS [Actinomyces wuliandei]|uniref:phosphate ABC transporter substrate-binding protein PstS n=1 Tax=Actinomyces wuliandei TaxID=2057743 RepID=UPI001FAA3305|nr:phosphate ABC transporter substrate-binding protein PstS [Actinomyces wuliandei]